MGTPLGPKYIPYTYMDPLGESLGLSGIIVGHDLWSLPKERKKDCGIRIVTGCPVKNNLRVQVLNNHILTQNLYYDSYYAKPKYLNIGYMDP